MTLRSYRWKSELHAAPQNIAALKVRALISSIKGNEAFDLTISFTKKPGTQRQEVAMCKKEQRP